MRTPRSLYAALGLVILMAGVGFGFALAQFSDPYANLDYETAAAVVDQDRRTDHTGADVDFDQFWTVWDTITERHVNQPVSEVDLLYGAIAGMVSGLNDPYSIYFEPVSSQEFLGEINGSFEGIGAEIGIKSEKLTVIAPLSGSPAEQSGLLAGDIIIAIDDIDTSFMSLNVAVGFIRGEEGTTVTLTIKRDGTDEPFNLEIQRGQIQIESVKWEIEEAGSKRLARITLSHFNADTSLKFQEVINEIVLEQPDGIILDVRNNAGGFLDAAISIASSFIENGKVVVYEEDSSGTQKPYTASAPTPLGDLETIVLVNGGSASASEILAGALQDHEDGVVVGMQTFGKGTVQDLQQYDDGSSLKLTVAKWLTPSRNLIDGLGITPDIIVDRTPEDYSADLDPQLDAAKLFFSDRSAFEAQYTVEEEIEEVDESIE